jgi:2-phosphoglycerate kinase
MQKGCSMHIERDGLIASDRELQEQLRHVYWIGGGSGAGKSTIARRIAHERRLQLYATDDAMPDHARRSTPETTPLLHEFIAMDMDERWVHRSPQSMLESFHWFRGEGFGMIIDDLARLPREPGVIAEGFRLLPQLVQPLLATPRHAVWLLPTAEFRQAVFESRGGTQWGFIGKTSHPQRALRNLLERDAMFTDQLAEEAKRRRLNTILVDSRMTVDDLVSQVLEIFGL